MRETTEGMARKNIAEAMKPDPTSPEVLTYRVDEIEHWPIAKPKAHKRNAKNHPPEQVTYLAGLISRHGFDQPIVVDGKGVIIKGHGRLLAAKHLKLATVPVVVRSDMSPGLVAEARIADNRVAEFGWNMDQLVSDVVDGLKIGMEPEVIGWSLKDLGLEHDADSGEIVDTGLHDEDEHEVARPVYLPVVEPETPAPPKKATTKLGQVWHLGEHVLVCGDSTQLKPAFDVDTIFTDPPYGVSWQSRSDRAEKFDLIANDKLSGDDLVAFIKAAVPEAANRFVCCNYRCYATFEQALGKPQAVIVWDKGSIGLGHSNFYRPQHEWIMFFGPTSKGGSSLSDLWQFKRDQNYQHPTQKPVALVAKALTDVKAQAVYDPFGGSGSTLLAAEQLGIKCSTIELEPKYVDVIISRWQNLTGKKAKLVKG